MSDRGVGLGEATRRAVERAERERRQAGADGPQPRPGDLYALPATADHQVEWLVVAPAEAAADSPAAAPAAAPSAWLVLPADLSPVAGATDVEVPADEPGGPLTVYGRFPVTVPASLLAPELRSGRVAEGRRAAAERRWRDLAGGADTPRREADHDPDYRRRLAELAAAQQALAAAAGAAEPETASGGREGGGGAGAGGACDGAAAAPVIVPARLRRPQPSRFRPPPWMTALAAALALAVVALGGWNLLLLRQIDELSGVRRVATGPELIVDEVTRGGDLTLPDEDFVVLTLVWQRPPDPTERFRVAFVAPDGEELAAVRGLAPGRRGEAAVEVPRSVLAAASRLRLFRVGDRGEPEPILERPIRLDGD